MRKSFALTAILFSIWAPAGAQKLEWLAGFDGFLDNREYFTIDNPYTVFGARFRAEAGGSLSDLHSIHAGFNYLYEFGYRIDAHKPLPTLYYQYYDGKIRLSAGAFPRRDLLDYPIALLSDTLLYYRPNIEGVYFSYSGTWGHQNVFIDWTSRQTDADHERFIFGSSGRVNWRFLFLTHHFLMGHFAGPAIPVPGEHLRDNGGFDINLGADLSERVFLDTLICSLGALVSVDRTRSVDESFQTPAGFLGQFTGMYKGIGLTGTLYSGKGHTFLYGDPFYRLRDYARLDVFYAPFRSGPVRMKFDFGFHFAGNQIDYSQQILISMTLGNSRLINP
jgi:hypothetical protein